MVGKTDEYGNQVLDLPDEEEGDDLDSEPQLIYFPKYGNFQLSGLEASYTNITKRQARQMVEFINQVLGRESMSSTGQISDGYHTFDELYRYRMIYHAWAVREWQQVGYPVVKSHRHSDGESCFGGGWFIVSAQLPTGQVSNHYEDEYWDLFDCPEVEKAPEWDGHTPQQAADRIETALKEAA